ncbi:MAG: hypothetical protein V3S21_06130 [Xanthomonadales bacterium]
MGSLAALFLLSNKSPSGDIQACYLIQPRQWHPDCKHGRRSAQFTPGKYRALKLGFFFSYFLEFCDQGNWFVYQDWFFILYFHTPCDVPDFFPFTYCSTFLPVSTGHCRTNAMTVDYRGDNPTIQILYGTGGMMGGRYEFADRVGLCLPFAFDLQAVFVLWATAKTVVTAYLILKICHLTIP